MNPHLLQTVSQSGSYDAVTIVLIVIFLSSATLTAVLLLRQPRSPDPNDDPQPQVLSNPDDRSFTSQRIASTAPVPQQPRQEHMPQWLRIAAPELDETLFQIAHIVRVLERASNTGDIAAGFNLYTDSYRRKVVESYGFDPSKLGIAQCTGKRRSPGLMTSAEIRTFELQAPNMATVVVDFAHADGKLETERIRVAFNSERTRWEIEDISAVDAN